MKRLGLLLAMMMLSLVFVDGGWAGPKHYVASYGLDTNPCTLASPCRSFSHAVDVTDAGGEVIVLDTEGYGTITITKSISIIAPVGVYACVKVTPLKNGIMINAGASDTVLIKGLTIKGSPLTGSGIYANTVGKLIVDNCFISEMYGRGISLSAPNSELVILNSKINNNSNTGVYVYNSSGSVSVSMNNVEMVKNNAGFALQPSETGNVSATVTNSLANNNTYGFVNSGSSSGTSVLSLEHCNASGNNYAIYIDNNSDSDITRLSNCTITGNSYGVYRADSSSGTIYTKQNNTIEGNNTGDLYNVTLTPYSAK